MGFSRKSKLAASVIQDVNLSGLHADHIIPKSKNGPSDVANLQLILPKTNMQKSNRKKELREWQSEFLKAWNESKDSSFLCVAIPGGGKTIAALTAGFHFLEAANDRRLLIVVPTDNLRKQWRDEATAFGINLQTKEFGTNFKDGFQGAVVTYQSLDTNAQMLRAICGRTPTMVILDEPHHCGDRASWGSSAKEAFSLAKRRLLLSGTPFRTDGQPIPFIQYDGSGVCIHNYRYDYPHALRDGVVRTLFFDYSKGDYTVITPSGQERYELNSSISEDEAAARLRHILNPDGEFVAEQIRRAHEKLSELRRVIPDAAAMAVCIDQAHASKVARLIRQETGSEPSVIVSDDEIATASVDQFKKNRKEWVVSVRQISEGTDIKRLQVLCYLTNATTEIFFRQLIGRVSRVRYRESAAPSDAVQDTDREAYVYLPSDPRLIEHAKNIEDAQDRAIRSDAEETIERGPMERQVALEFFVGSNHKGVDMVVVGSKQYSSDEADKIASISSEFGLTKEKAALVFEKYERHLEKQSPVTSAPENVDQISKEEVLDKLRRKCNSYAFRVSKIIQCEPSQVHGKFKPQAKMTEAELCEKLNVLARWIVNKGIA